MKRLDRRTSPITALSMIAVGCVIALSSFAVVRAEHAKSDGSKTFKCSSGTACLQAKSTGSSTAGVYGTSTTQSAVIGASSEGYGVLGVSGGSAGVFGESSASSYSYPGVYGYSDGANTGVAGYSTGGTGVFGTGGEASNGGYPGVWGHTAEYAYGVYGDAPYGYGVGAEGSVAGAYVEGTGTAIALMAEGADSKTDLFQANNGSTGQTCFIDYDANMTCTGTITGGELRTRHHASSGRRVLAYASESASATMEDVGHGRLFDGVANVQISPDFASVIDRSDYYVFLTPMGDASLYVSVKTANAFQVRQVNRGRSSLAFDYRIVARPIDADGDRLPPAPHVRHVHVNLPHLAPQQLPPPPKLKH